MEVESLQIHSTVPELVNEWFKIKGHGLWDTLSDHLSRFIAFMLLHAILHASTLIGGAMNEQRSTLPQTISCLEVSLR